MECQQQPGQRGGTGANPEAIDKVFDLNDPEAGYQRKYTVNVGPKSEDCFVLESVLIGQIMNFHFMVRLQKETIFYCRRSRKVNMW